MVKNLFKNPIFLTVLLSGIAVDQITKLLVQMFVEKSSSTSFIDIVFHQNAYIAFSIPLPGFFISTFALFALLFVLWKYGDILFFSNRISTLFFGLIFAGAIGNIVDRILHGYVIDFIQIGNFPVFNIADMMITSAGVMGLLFYTKVFREEKK